MITRGSCTSAPASATFCRMPLEKPSQRSCAWSARPSQSEQLARARLGDGGIDAPQPGDEFEIFERRELVVDHRLVGDPRHDLLGRDRIGERVDAEHRDRAGVGPQQPDHHAQGRGLAGAVGAEQRVELARAHASGRGRRPRAGRSAWSGRGFRGPTEIAACSSRSENSPVNAKGSRVDASSERFPPRESGLIKPRLCALRALPAAGSLRLNCGLRGARWRLTRISKSLTWRNAIGRIAPAGTRRAGFLILAGLRQGSANAA